MRFVSSAVSAVKTCAARVSDFAHETAGKAAAVVATVAGAVMISSGFASNANATIDPSVSTAFTAIQTDASSLSGIVVPIVVAVLGLFITIKLIKKFGNKI